MEDRWETCCTANDLSMANLVRARLESEGFEVLVPDENMGSMAWHLGNAIGGVRVQVPAADLERAVALLDQEELEVEDEDELAEDPNESPMPSTDEASEQESGDAIAHRALKAAVVSTFLIFVVPYVFSLVLQARSEGDLSDTGRRNVRNATVIATIITIAGFTILWAVKT